MAYVYRFVDKNNKVIYYGKTINIDSRMQQHFTKGHLPKECYKSVAKIEYQKYKTESDSLIMEQYYICKYDPKYNKQGKSRDVPTIELEESKWKTYRTIKPITQSTNQEVGFIWKLISIGFEIYLIYLLIEWLVNIF